MKQIFSSLLLHRACLAAHLRAWITKLDASLRDGDGGDGFVSHQFVLWISSFVLWCRLLDPKIPVLPRNLCQGSMFQSLFHGTLSSSSVNGYKKQKRGGVMHGQINMGNYWPAWMAQSTSCLTSRLSGALDVLMSAVRFWERERNRDHDSQGLALGAWLNITRIQQSWW